MNNIKDLNSLQIPHLSDVHIEDFNLKGSFIDFAGHFKDLVGTVILLSGQKLDSSNYNILAVKPWLEIYSKDEELKIISNGKTSVLNTKPFEILKEFINKYNIRYDLNLPIVAGLFGYFSYDLKDQIEKLPKTSVDDLNLPDLCLYAPSIIIIQDIKNQKSKICIPIFNQANNDKINNSDYIREQFDFINHQINIPCKKKENSLSSQSQKPEFISNFIKQDYFNAIKQIKQYIIDGHVYQVNMSQRFEIGFDDDPFLLFKNLFLKNPAPFFSFINAGNHHIISTSPERFVLLNKKYVEVRPIKGTIPRGKTKTEDDANKQQLINSKKDDAELSMIVDLLRNDIGKVCKKNSVKVLKHKNLESYENVYHLVSTIKGTIDDKYDAIDLLFSTFPGGSITGCPKIRAMEIIDELEPVRRHIYTGSIGYISFHNTMDLSIAIRTATFFNKKIYFSVGGGIVFDSDPYDEFNETLHKGKTLMQVLQNKEADTQNENQNNQNKIDEYCWINGSFKQLDQATIKISDLGLLYGYGFFETIKVDNGKPQYLLEHIKRFNKTWKDLFNSKVADVTWDEIIKILIEKNNLNKTTAVVKIVAAIKDQNKDNDNNYNNTNLFVFAKPYENRFKDKYNAGIKLGIYPEPRQTPIASYKTLNYLYYYLAGIWAKKNGYDEAIILNPDGSISETNTANLILIKNKNIILPKSDHVLPGVMQNGFCNELIKKGYTLKWDTIFLDDLFSFDQVLISNSLIETISVASVDGKKLSKLLFSPFILTA